MIKSLRVKILISLAVVTVVGYALKFYRGPADEWINDLGPASIPYEMMLMLFVFFFVPEQKNIFPIAVGVCVVTCILEFLQLWKAPWLMVIRSTLPGRALLGNTFSWWDLPAYPVGCLVGYWYLRWIAGSGGNRSGSGESGDRLLC